MLSTSIPNICLYRSCYTNFAAHAHVFTVHKVLSRTIQPVIKRCSNMPFLFTTDTTTYIYIFFTIRPTDQHARTCKSPYYVNTNTDKHTIHLHTCHTRLTAYTLNYCSVFFVVDRVQQGVCSQGFVFFPFVDVICCHKHMLIFF